ncbi:MAG: DUF2950 family protein [Terriglobales bacterium]|jgi:hypothetical protein
MAADSVAAASTAVAADDGSQLWVSVYILRRKGTSMSRGLIRNLAQRSERAAHLSTIAMIVIAFACVAAGAQQSAPAGVYVPSEQPKARAFSKPEEAASAIYAAAKRNDEADLLLILGPDAKEVVHWSDDPAERQKHREMFAQKYEQMHRLVKEPDNTIALYVGSENWPMPIPLVKYHGAWYFDADLGRQEIRYRRIGGNEMRAVEVCRTLVDAEKEYHATANRYTAKFMSGDSSHDGLYWKTVTDAAKSPIGPYLAQAGVGAPAASHSQPFHGYYYRILLQGSDGFAIVAFPAEYRSSGVMTFFVSQDGKAYEKDLGERTAALSNEVSSSDDSWKAVQ